MNARFLRKRQYRDRQRHYPNDLRIVSRSLLRRNGDLYEMTLCRRHATTIVEIWTPADEPGVWLRLLRLPLPIRVDPYDPRLARQLLELF